VCVCVEITEMDLEDVLLDEAKKIKCIYTFRYLDFLLRIINIKMLIYHI